MDFTNEAKHSDKLIVREEQPWNAEPPLATLIQHHITPIELVYARNHCPIKPLDATTFELKVDGLVENEAEYTLEDLKSSFPKVEVVAALQCAGNRRKAMQDKTAREVEGLLWGEGTICNVRWGGVLLRDVLARAHIQPQNTSGLHVCFASDVTKCEQDEWFGASVPLEVVLDAEKSVLLAYEMNGQPLPPDHGAPLRVVIPGHSGARWVKWVSRITLSQHESPNFYQQRDYKVLPPSVTSHPSSSTKEKEGYGEEVWDRVPPLQETPLNSVIACATATPSGAQVRGYAIRSGHTEDGQVKKVCVSVDSGASWAPARIVYQEGRWSWTLWEAEVPLPIGKVECHGTVLSRAEDERGNMQPPKTEWNLRGVAYAGYGEAQF